MSVDGELGTQQAGLDRLEIKVLGELVVTRAGVPLEIRPAMVRTLLAVLAVAQGRPVSRERIVAALWGAEPPVTARNLVHTYVSRLRQQLRGETEPADDAGPVVLDRSGYRLAVEPEDLDLVRFERRYREACRHREAGDVEAALRACTEALACWRGEFLADLDPQLRESAEAAEAQRCRLEAVVLYADLCREVGRPALALEPLRSAAAGAPLQENLHGRLMAVLADTGDRVAALDVYTGLRERLAEELGIDPGRQLEQLYLTILRDENGDRDAPGGEQRDASRPTPVATPQLTREPVPVPGPGPVPGTATAAEVGATGVPGPPPVPVPARSRRGRLVTVALATAAVVIAGTGLATALRWRGSAAPSAAAAAGTVTEEFDGNQLNPELWGRYERTFRNGASWSESMLRVGQGELQILGVGTARTGAGNMSGGTCWFCIHRKQVKRYGVWEVRAKFDAGAGYAPEIGLYPVDDTKGQGSLVISAEEPTRSNVFAVLFGDGHTRRRGEPLPGEYASWVTYRIEWRPSFVRVTADDRVLLDTRTAGEPVTIPTTPMYLYLQQRVGPDGSTPGASADTPSRVVMHIDWARYTP